MVKGINFKENNNGTIEVGIHSDFITYLLSIPTNNAGYRNFNLTKNFKPSVKGGYTHRLELVGSGKVTGQQLNQVEGKEGQ